jgi:hypothetical protein
MGCCYSYVDRQNQKKLNLLETLNKTIDNLRLLQNEEGRQQDLLRTEKRELEQEVVEQKKLLASVKEKHSQTIETIKMFECKICMEKLNKVMLIPCGHCFCLDCARNIKECPLCRCQVQGINNIYFN